MLKVIQQALSHKENIAIYQQGNHYTYAQLIQAANSVCSNLLETNNDLNEARVAFMVNPGFDYVTNLWGIWQAGGVAVPLCLTHPLPSLQYVLEDTQASFLIISKEFETVLAPFINSTTIKLIIIEEFKVTSSSVKAILPDISKDRMALILYTSGTTNKPKGVVTTHHTIEAQISTLINAWEWTSKDNTICVLPLHHVHGIINVVGCSLWAGATCRFTQQFSTNEIFSYFKNDSLNIFMAVPTIYFKLMTAFENCTIEEQAQLTQSMKKFRLMVCGSAALPVSVMEKWEKISGQRLLERYGMTELGMAISNPYRAEIGDRKAGYVGLPLPGVQVKLVDENYQDVLAEEPGEIIVKGDNVFKQYWQRPEVTAQSFTTEGWFKTGDIAIIENGYYRIMGRNSVDIIKSGGYKISALEIEEVVRENEMISDCAVVGIDDEEWGELIVAAVVLNEKYQLNFSEATLTNWLVQKMAPYKKPRRYLILDELPRNAMGKVVKNDLKKLFK